MGMRFFSIPPRQTEPVNLVSVVSGRTLSSEAPGPATTPRSATLRYTRSKANTALGFRGGALAPGVPVQLLFWGSFWLGPGAAQRHALESHVKQLLTSPYFDALDQYGLTPPVFAASRVVTDPKPRTLPDTFNGGHISGLVWDLIDNGVFPEPDEGGRNAYYVMMPPNTLYEDGAGAHTSRFHLEPVADIDWAWVAWSNYSGDTGNMTATFSHEMVELMTDPEPGGGYYARNADHEGNEIADLCQPDDIWQTAYVGDVKVMAYWSRRDDACIIPTFPFKVRVDGTIRTDSIREVDSGNQAYPLGNHPPLCLLFPECCFAGPYAWKRQLFSETVSLEASLTGYHTPTLSWSVNGRTVTAGGDLPVEATVTRLDPGGTTVDDETVHLQVVLAGNRLRLTNTNLLNVDLVVTAVVDETSASGALGAKRAASVTVPFHGVVLDWDEQFAKDKAACQSSTDRLIGIGKKEEVGRPGPLNPGPMHEDDQRYLAGVPSWASEGNWREARLALLKAHRLWPTDPDAAAALRDALLGASGLPRAGLLTSGPT
jgi:hypothetical protein